MFKTGFLALFRILHRSNPSVNIRLSRKQKRLQFYRCTTLLEVVWVPRICPTWFGTIIWPLSLLTGPNSAPGVTTRTLVLNTTIMETLVAQVRRKSRLYFDSALFGKLRFHRSLDQAKQAVLGKACRICGRCNLVDDTRPENATPICLKLRRSTDPTAF